MIRKTIFDDFVGTKVYVTCGAITIYGELERAQIADIFSPESIYIVKSDGQTVSFSFVAKKSSFTFNEAGKIQIYVGQDDQ